MEKDLWFGNMTGNAGSISDIKAKAKSNRKNPTQAESILWEHLRNDYGKIRFRRQHVIGDYIADFVCLRNKLVIEIDGGYHESDEQQESDAYRTWYLSQRGFRVIRFKNEEVINNIEQVLTKITKSLVP